MRRSTLALALGSLLLSAAGCRGTTSGEGGGGSTGSDPLCPIDLSLGELCSPEGEQCVYDGGGCTINALCADGTWVVDSSTCVTECGTGESGGYCAVVGDACISGYDCGARQWECKSDHTWWVKNVAGPCCGSPVHECPAQMPIDGSPCDPCSDLAPCAYSVFTACGEQEAQLQCAQGGVWEVLVAPSCDCAAHATIDACSADPGCRYLSGGCDAPTLDAGACFPLLDCSGDIPCPDGTLCTAVNANDCGIDPCVQCVSVSVCL